MTDLAPIVWLGLLLLRPGMLLTTAPAFGTGFAPAPVRLGLLLIIGLTLMPMVAIPAIGGVGSLTLIAARETVIGLALGLSVRVLLAGVELAGYLAGFQLGFSYAALVDPMSGARNNIMSAFYGMFALMIFLLVDGHHQMLRALAASYDALPLGMGGVSDSLPLLVARSLGFVFILGAQLAAPVVLVLLVVELALGVMARAVPALNLMVVGAPARLLVGLIVIAATVHVLPPVVRGVIPSMLDLAARMAAAFR